MSRPGKYIGSPLLFGARVVDPNSAGLSLSRLLELAGIARERFGMRVQFMDPGELPDREFVLMAVEKAEEAFARGDNVANDLSLELLRFASGKRQIQKALDRLGVKDGARELLVLLLPWKESDLKPGQQNAEELRLWLCGKLGLTEDETLPERAFARSHISEADCSGDHRLIILRKERLEAMAVVDIGGRVRD